MKRGHLSSYFVRIAWKKLSATEVDINTSRGHEFQGVKALREIFGPEKYELPAVTIHLSDEHEEGSLRESVRYKWYDSRENQPSRSSEYRLYYTGNFIPEHAKPGDSVFLFQKTEGAILVLLTPSGSTYEKQLLWLCGIQDEETPDSFKIKSTDGSADKAIDMASRIILENIGLPIENDLHDFIEEMVGLFGQNFPPTAEFSRYARQTIKDGDAVGSPDDVISEWIDREDALFRTFEKHLISDRIKAGFPDVDEFIKFSLSVQNRRKSRAGNSLENHLEEIFKLNKIVYKRGGRTEKRSKPDFLFPGEVQYADKNYPADRLMMLGVKTTCKDRWRQVLAEADRIHKKHLFTLEPGISEHQTLEMTSHNLHLVLPKTLHNTYTQKQLSRIFSLQQFIQLLNN